MMSSPVAQPPADRNPRASAYPRSCRRCRTTILYIADHGTDATARKFVVALLDHCRAIAALPGMLGTARPDLATGLRSTPHNRYIVYFRYGGDALEIVNILDASRDALAHFTDDHV